MASQGFTSLRVRKLLRAGEPKGYPLIDGTLLGSRMRCFEFTERLLEKTCTAGS